MTNAAKNTAPADVFMLMGTQCAFCGPMMQALTELMKAGQINRLEIVNIEHNLDLAAELGVRSVPWLRIGPFELAGSRSKQELSEWLDRAASDEGIRAYMEEVLSEGNIEAVRKLLKKQPEALKNVLELMADGDAKINVRLGVGVIIEEMAQSEAFKKVIPQLLEYLHHEDPRVRSDACHNLSLTGDPAYIPAIEKLLDDESAEVREIAQDSIDSLKQA
ncbi:MAG TPA: HEAT repeat domain-containing protein [Gammaproteobacteria bacterium]|nr:HEAT repeat domain-containing protein [Gammaproteobacteria bacterium]